MRGQKKILFITSGIFPFFPKSDQSIFIRNLLQGISEKGMEVRIFMPKYGTISERKYQLHEVVRFSGTNLMIDSHFLFIKVASLPLSRLQVYFVDNEEFFKRKYFFHDEKGDEFLDNGDRSIFFVRGVIETIKKLRWAPDIVHCHGWITSLVPIFIKRHYLGDFCFENAKFIYSIYNDGFRQSFSNSAIEKLQQMAIFKNDIEYLNYTFNYESLTKLAINFSDGVCIQDNHPLFFNLKDFLDKKESIHLLPSVLSGSYDIKSICNFYDQLLV